jgi:hypothetical protein
MSKPIPVSQMNAAQKKAYSVMTPAQQAAWNKAAGTGVPAVVAPPVVQNTTKQGVDQSLKLYQPVINAAQSKLTAGLDLNNANWEQTQSDIKKRIAATQEGLRSDLSSRGFMRSGEQVGTGTLIEEQGLRDINQAQINKAIADADLILNNAQFIANVGVTALGAGSTIGNTLFNQQMKTLGFDQSLYNDLFTAQTTLLNSSQTPSDEILQTLHSLLGLQQ